MALIFRAAAAAAVVEHHLARVQIHSLDALAGHADRRVHHPRITLAAPAAICSGAPWQQGALVGR